MTAKQNPTVRYQAFDGLAMALPDSIYRDAARAREKSAEITTEGFNEAKDTTHLAQMTFDFFEKIHRPVLGALHTVSSLVPPLRIVLVAISAIWETIAAIFFPRESRRQRLLNVLLAGLSVGAVVIGVLNPMLAGFALVAYISFELIKGFSHFVRSVRRYHKLKRQHAKAIASKDPDMLQYARKLRFRKHVTKDKGMDVGTSAIAVSGAILAVIPPFGVAGLVILIVATAVSVISKLRNLIKRKKMKHEYNHAMQQEKKASNQAGAHLEISHSPHRALGNAKKHTNNENASWLTRKKSYAYRPNLTSVAAHAHAHQADDADSNVQKPEHGRPFVIARGRGGSV